MTNRDMPGDLVELMTMALAGGNIDEVNLVFEGMGYDFYGPIGWFLYLTKVSPELLAGSGDRSTATLNTNPAIVCVQAQVSNPVPTAFLGMDPQTEAAQYWDAVAIAEWIDTPRDTAATGDVMTVPAEHIRMAVDAAKLGWSVTQQIRRFGRGATSLPPDLEIPVAMSYRFDAHNYSYNDKSSNRHCDTGADLSLNLALGTDEESEGWNYALRNGQRVDPALITEAVAQNPPWHRPVAYFDEELDEWVL